MNNEEQEPKLHIEYFGGMFPVQAFGTLGNERFYFRFRHTTYLTQRMGVGSVSRGNMFIDETGLYSQIDDVFSERPDEVSLSDDEIMNLIHELIDGLRLCGDWVWRGGKKMTK